MQTKTINVKDIVFREDLYPRLKPNPAKIQECGTPYAVVDFYSLLTVDKFKDLIIDKLSKSTHPCTSVHTNPQP